MYSHTPYHCEYTRPLHTLTPPFSSRLTRATLQPLAMMKLPRGVYGLDIAHDGLRIAVAGGDCMVRVVRAPASGGGALPAPPLPAPPPPATGATPPPPPPEFGATDAD